MSGEVGPEVEAEVCGGRLELAGNPNMLLLGLLVEAEALCNSTGSPALVDRLKVSNNERPWGPEDSSILASGLKFDTF